MSKKYDKQRLLEVMGRLDKSFKPKLNEESIKSVSMSGSEKDGYSLNVTTDTGVKHIKLSKEETASIQGSPIQNPNIQKKQSMKDFASKKLSLNEDFAINNESMSEAPADGSTSRPLYQIAQEIRQDWRPIHPYAKPYWEAMSSLDSVNDNYGMDSGKSIVAYFLSNASTWKGETAKRIKIELKKMIGLKEDVMGEEEIAASEIGTAVEETGVSEGKYDIDPTYTHFAVSKANGKIVFGWEYKDIEPSELRQFKKDYFTVDIINLDIDPKLINVYTKNTLERQGINPFDQKNWSNDIGETLQEDDLGLGAGEQGQGVKFRADVAGVRENVWSTNAKEYDTEEEAKAALDSLADRWFGFDLSRVVPSTTPRNQPVDMQNDVIYQNMRR